MKEVKIIAPSCSRETNILIHFLKAVEVGDLVLYADVQSLIKSEANKTMGREEVRNFLWQARKFLEKHYNMFFGAVHGEGIKRLDDNEVVSAASGYVRRAKTSLDRAEKMVSATDNEKLSDESKDRKKSVSDFRESMENAFRQSHELHMRIKPVRRIGSMQM